MDTHNVNTAATASMGQSNPGRQKKLNEIAHENIAMFKRIMSVKPSKETSKRVHMKDFQKNQARKCVSLLAWLREIIN